MLLSQAKATSDKKCKDTFKFLVSSSFRGDVMFGTAQKFLVQVFNFKIVLAENIASDIQKKSYIKNHLNLCFSHRPRQHHKKCRHTQIPCFRLFQIGYRVRQSSKVLGARVQFFYQKILRQIIAKKNYTQKLLDFALFSQVKAASHKKCKDTLKFLVSASFR